MQTDDDYFEWPKHVAAFRHLSVNVALTDHLFVYCVTKLIGENCESLTGFGKCPRNWLQHFYINLILHLYD